MLVEFYLINCIVCSEDLHFLLSLFCTAEPKSSIFHHFISSFVLICLSLNFLNLIFRICFFRSSCSGLSLFQKAFLISFLLVNLNMDSFHYFSHFLFNFLCILSSFLIFLTISNFQYILLILFFIEYSKRLYQIETILESSKTSKTAY